MTDTVRIQRDVDLTGLNTLGLPARAGWFAVLEDATDLPVLLEAAEVRDRPRLWLGGGSNLVFSRDVDGLVVHIASRGRRLLREDREYRYLAIAAGENWHALVRWTLAQGWGGLENLALIPGTVGAAPVQNIGAYGLELAERFEGLTAWDGERHDWVRLAAEDCRFGYRDSVFKQVAPERYLITEVVLRLPKAPELRLDYGDIRSELGAAGLATPTPADVADAVERIRRRKLPDPAVLGNAGSFFHNPRVSVADAEALKGRFPGLPSYPAGDGQVKLAAGWLIEQAGWKGRDLGRAGTYEHQALVLVNRGRATSDDVMGLAAAIRAAVLERFGVELRMEPRLI